MRYAAVPFRAFQVIRVSSGARLRLRARFRLPAFS